MRIPAGMNVIVALLMVQPCVTSMSGATRATGEQTDTRPAPAPVVADGEFMDLFLKSAYTELQTAMAKPPADRKEFAAIYRAAIRLAEIQNLLFFRAPNRFTEHPEWPGLSAKARQAAADLAAVALVGLRNVRPQDYEAVRSKYPAVAQACNACHKGVDATDAPTIKP